MSYYKLISLDFDGTLTNYTHTFKGDGIIEDEPQEGAKEFVEELQKNGYTVVIHSTRCRSPEGRAAIMDWCRKYGIPIKNVYSTKPPAICTLDDRAITFNGDFKEALAEIFDFEPYYRKVDI